MKVVTVIRYRTSGGQEKEWTRDLQNEYVQQIIIDPPTDIDRVFMDTYREFILKYMELDVEDILDIHLKIEHEPEIDFKSNLERYGMGHLWVPELEGKKLSTIIKHFKPKLERALKKKPEDRSPEDDVLIRLMNGETQLATK